MLLYRLLHGRVYADYSKKRNQTPQTVSIENSDLSLSAKENEIDSFIEEVVEQEQIKKIFVKTSFLSKIYLLNSKKVSNAYFEFQVAHLIV